MLEEKILNTITKYKMIESGDSIVIGVSGGPDSMCLLQALIQIKEKNKLNYKIYVAHINHGLRKEADGETKYVQDFCAKNNIECFVKKENVDKIAKEQKIGTEEAGRKLRYSFFEEIKNETNSNKIAIAHNLNDKVETILMNIIRGTGTNGLTGIEPIRNNLYIRPLIEIERKEIEKYCEENKLEPKIDKTNFENIYTRNKVRNLLIPYIKKEFNPNIVDAIDKLSKISTEEQNDLNKLVNNIYSNLLLEENINKEAKHNQIILDLKKFNTQDLVIKRKIILYTIRKVYGNTNNIAKIHIDDIVKMCEKNIGNKYLTPHKNIKVYVKKGKIFFMA
mgnify:FL=1